MQAGDIITIDGASGQVMRGEIPTIKPELSGDFGHIMEWADGIRRLGIRANADTPTDARMAREFGAEGIGLCRTEHMFFENERIAAVREMIVADTDTQRRTALAKLLPMQRADFVELFEIMAGLPVTIRLLDPPLHEFLPHGEEEILEVAGNMDIDPEVLRARVAELRRIQPDAGPSRLPVGGHLSGNCRNAGAGDFRGSGRGNRQNRYGTDPGSHDPFDCRSC